MLLLALPPQTCPVGLPLSVPEEQALITISTISQDSRFFSSLIGEGRIPFLGLLWELPLSLALSSLKVRQALFLPWREHTRNLYLHAPSEGFAGSDQRVDMLPFQG